MARRRATPTTLQLEAAECGAAALRIILAYHERFVPLAELRAECGVSRDGSRASSMVKAARRYGMLAKGSRHEVRTVAALPPPYIVFWNLNHFLVVEGIDLRRGRAWLNDPARGHREVTLAEFSGGFSGVVLEITPGPDFQPGGEDTRLAAPIAQRLRRSAPALGLSFALGLLLVLPGIALPGLTQAFIDQVLIGGHVDWIRPLILAIVVFAALQAGLRALQLRLLTRLQVKLAVVFGAGFVDHLLRLPMAFYAQRYAGEIASRVALNDRIAYTISAQLVQSVIDLTLLALYGLAMALYSPPLAAIVAAGAAIYVLILWASTRRRAEASLRLSIEESKAMSAIVAAIQSIETVKANGLEPDAYARWAGHYAGTVRMTQDLARSDGRIVAGVGALHALLDVAVLACGAALVMRGELSIGSLVAFQLLTSAFVAPLSAVVGFATSFRELGGDLLRVEDVMRHPPAWTPGPDAPAAGPAHLSGALEMRGITFGYSRAAPPIVEGFHLALVPGQHVALVGGSGSGKSTLGRILAGLEAPWAGEVTLDGIPRARLPRHVVARGLAVVDQDIVIFEGSLRDNLTLWDPNVPDRQLLRACEDAVLTEVVRALPGGLDGRLLEGGANLSGGQRQRLEIARALVHDPAVVLLDEATSALDTETEALVMQNLRRRRCSCILIAHRLSTIRDCDEIILLSQGRVLERGTHDQLLAEPSGRYRELILREGGLA